MLAVGGIRLETLDVCVCEGGVGVWVCVRVFKRY